MKREDSNGRLSLQPLPFFRTVFFKNIPGPTYSSSGNMQYLGVARLGSDDIHFTNGYTGKKKKNSPFNEIISWFETPSEHKRAAALMNRWLILGMTDDFRLDVSKEDYHLDSKKHGEERHVFAARFKMHYSSLKGAYVDGIRPFGDMKKHGDHYKYYMEVSTPDKSGLQCEACKHKFKFPAPSNYNTPDDKKAPWNRVPSPAKPLLYEQEPLTVEEWITDYSQVIKPVRRAGCMEPIDPT
ncbi:hypothetical protein [Desulfoluna spongiiphila]|nr:hypothetical protein [Desulfoluna spongiiphila]